MSENGLGQVNAETSKEKEAEKQILVESRSVKLIEGGTHKKGIHVMFSNKEDSRLRWPRRYSSNV